MKPIKFFLIILFIALSLVAKDNPPYDYERPAGDISNDNCNSSKQFAENLTGITFFGDSRLDYVDNYGYNMLYYINNEQDGGPNRVAPSFGVQNFGQSSWTSLQLGDFLSKCMSSSQTNFKTADKFVVNIGGNDWMWSATTITLSVRHAKSNKGSDDSSGMKQNRDVPFKSLV